MTTRESSVKVPANIMFQELAGESVLLNLTTGKYYGLDEVGTRMWALLSEHKRLELVIKALLNEYEVPAAQLEKDLIALIDRLADNGLLEVENG